MNLNQNNPENKGSCTDTFDNVIEWLLVALLAFMPFAFGAVEAWSEEVVIALSAAITICFLLKLIFRKDANLVWSWAYIPVVIFIFIALLQIIPLPTGVVELISSNTAAVKKELLGDLPNAGKLLSTMTISFYSYATRHDLRLILAISAVFFVVVNVYRSAGQIKRLLAAIAAIGGAVAILALAQVLLGNGKIYWFVPTFDRAFSGTFVNHSHFGQFMNLSIGATFALVMVRLHEAFAEKKVTPSLAADYFGSSQAKVIWVLVVMIILGATAVFTSLTRGGMVSMFIAAAFTTLILSSRKSLKGRGWIMALLTLGAFICVLYMGFDAVYDRLATLGKLHETQGGRWQIVKDLSIAWTKFPLFGTGFGTHEVVYPMFDRSTIPSLAAYAENEYAQAAEETGIIGLAALAVFAAIIWISYARNITTGSIPIRSAAYGLGFGLVAIMIHSFSDFGQHILSNAFLSAISCALLLALAQFGRENSITSNPARSHRGRRVLFACVLLCSIIVWTWALLDADNARLAETRWNNKVLAAEYGLAEKGGAGTNEEYIDLISNAASAVDYQPGNVQYRHWLNVYRWRSLSRVTDPDTGQVIMPEEAIQFVYRIADELNKARFLCPTYGATYCVLGQLEMFILNDPGGAENIRKGYHLAPCDPTSCFLAGLLDIEQRQVYESLEKLVRAVQLDARLFKDVAALYINHAERPDFALAMAGNDTYRLSQVADILANTRQHKEFVEQTRRRVIDLLKARCRQPEAPASALASLANVYKSQNNNCKAIECYRQALVKDYGQVGWRLTLARLLADEGNLNEAIHEARICLRLRPQFKAAEKLIADLLVRPAAKDVVTIDERRLTRDD
jgi:tetratricopeptide (TPR) repeat protein